MRSETVADGTVGQPPQGPAQPLGLSIEGRPPEADRVSVVLMANYVQPDSSPQNCTVRCSRLVRVEASPWARTYRVPEGGQVALDYADLDPDNVEVFIVNKTTYQGRRMPLQHQHLKLLAEEGVECDLVGPQGRLSRLRPGRGVWLDSPGAGLQLVAHNQAATLEVFMFPF